MSANSSNWAAYRAAQRARRHVRRRQRFQRLLDRLPPRGIAIQPLSATASRLEGYGFAIIYDPTHNTVQVPGDPSARMMTPDQVAGEFRWRWKREGCP